MQRHRKWGIFVIAACLVVFIGTSMSAVAKEDVAKRIRIWHTFTQPGRVAAMRKIADDFEKQTGIKVDIEIQSWGGVTQKWPIAFAAGTLPDMTSGVVSDLLAMWAVGATAPMNAVIDGLGGPDEFLAPAYMIKDKEGNYVIYPWYGGARILLYRKSILAQAGLTVPQTWDGLYDVAEAVTDPPNQYGFVQALNLSDYGQTVIMYALVYNLGGVFWDKDLNPTVDTPEVVRAAKYLKKLYQVAHPEGALDYMVHDLMDLWWTGKNILCFETTALQASCFEHNPEVGRDTGAALIPRPAPPRGPQTGYTAPRSFVIINKSAPVRRAVEKFLIFANQPENKVPFIHSMPFMVPTLRAVANDPMLWENPTIMAMKANQEVTFKAMEIGTVGGFEQGPNPFAALLERGIIEPMFHKIYIDNVPVEQAAKEAQAKISKAVKEQKQLLGWE